MRDIRRSIDITFSKNNETRGVPFAHDVEEGNTSTTIKILIAKGFGNQVDGNGFPNVSVRRDALEKFINKERVDLQNTAPWKGEQHFGNDLRGSSGCFRTGETCTCGERDVKIPPRVNVNAHLNTSMELGGPMIVEEFSTIR